MFKESLANALYDPTVDLALEQEWVDGATEIVDDRVSFNYDGAGIGIDLDLRCPYLRSQIVGAGLT